MDVVRQTHFHSMSSPVMWNSVIKKKRACRSTWSCQLNIRRFHEGWTMSRTFRELFCFQCDSDRLTSKWWREDQIEREERKKRFTCLSLEEICWLFSSSIRFDISSLTVEAWNVVVCSFGRFEQTSTYLHHHSIERPMLFVCVSVFDLQPQDMREACFRDDN